MEIETEKFKKNYSPIIEELGNRFWDFGFWRFNIDFEDGTSEMIIFNGTYNEAEDLVYHYVYEEIDIKNIVSIQLICNAIIPFKDNCSKYGCDLKNNICMR